MDYIFLVFNKLCLFFFFVWLKFLFIINIILFYLIFFVEKDINYRFLLLCFNCDDL